MVIELFFFLCRIKGINSRDDFCWCRIQGINSRDDLCWCRIQGINSRDDLCWCQIQGINSRDDFCWCRIQGINSRDDVLFWFVVLFCFLSLLLQFELSQFRRSNCGGVLAVYLVVCDKNAFMGDYQSTQNR